MAPRQGTHALRQPDLLRRYRPDVEDVTLHRATGATITTRELYAALDLRSRVFVVEQACVYHDLDGRDLDPTTMHLWLGASGDSIASYIRVLAESGGGRRIGRVITAPEWRGRNLAGRLIDLALETAERPVVLDGQAHLAEMYSRHGFVVAGPEYLDAGIPHLPMRLVE